MILSTNRKEIPPFQIIGQYDHARLLAEVESLNLLDTSTWADINFSDDTNKSFQKITEKHSAYYTRWFEFKQKLYADLFFNQIDYDLIATESKEDFHSAKSRARVITDASNLRKQRNAELIFKPVLKPMFQGTYIEEVYKDIGSKFVGGPGRIKIGWMGPNTEVKEHIDGDSALILKVHVPLVTDPRIEFVSKFKGESVRHHMPSDGSATLLNVGIPHSVVNPTDVDRFHMIINVYTFSSSC
jgi:hypothetical protein